MTKRMKIAVIGTGYVGLVAGAGFADLGHRVVCVDRDAERISQIRAGRMPIYEPGLEALVGKAIADGVLSFSTDIAESVADCDCAFIAVGTPPRNGDGEADLSAVLECAREIAQAIPRDGVIVTKSTVPAGTGERIERLVRQVRRDADIAVASNPEFLREGSAISDFLNPDRIVIGCETERAATVLSAVYQPLVDKGFRLLRTRRRSAELIKYASNAFLAVKITFINEMADLCEAIDADIGEVALGMGLDRRIGPNFLQAGPGYGGSCFPKDTLALVRTAQEKGIPLRLVEQTVMANTARTRHMAAKVNQALGGSVDGKRIAVLGLTFKADTDDMRASPSIPLIELLQRGGAEIHAFDPEGIGQARKIFSEVAFHHDPYQCAKGSDAIVFCTDWEVLKHLDLGKLSDGMRTRVMVDLRRLYSPEEAARHGFHVETIGRAGCDAHSGYHAAVETFMRSAGHRARQTAGKESEPA